MSDALFALNIFASEDGYLQSLQNYLNSINTSSTTRIRERNKQNFTKFYAVKFVN